MRKKNWNRRNYYNSSTQAVTPTSLAAHHENMSVVFTLTVTVYFLTDSIYNKNCFCCTVEPEKRTVWGVTRHSKAQCLMDMYVNPGSILLDIGHLTPKIMNAGTLKKHTDVCAYVFLITKGAYWNPLTDSINRVDGNFCHFLQFSSHLFAVFCVECFFVFMV